MRATDDETTDRPDDGAAPRTRSRRSARGARMSPRARRTITTVLVVLGCLVVVLVGLGVWVARDVLAVRDDLTVAADLVPELEQQVEDGAQDEAAATLEALQQRAASARESSTGVHWSVVSVLPVARPNLQAVQVVTEVVDSLAVDALPAFADAARLAGPGGFAQTDGRVDLGPLVEVAPRVVAADAAVQAGLDDMVALDPDELVGPLGDAVTELTDVMAEVGSTTATASRAVRLAPPMLGSEGPRRYLLLVQNNAEPRATGGLPGSVILLSAEDGRVTIEDQRPASEFQSDTTVLDVGEAERALFGEDLARKMADVNFTPDFPRTAELAVALWAQKDDRAVDGVLSIDPVVLAGIMGATGPIDPPVGPRLTSDNVVDYLINGVYLDIADPDQHDVFFQVVAAQLFQEVLAGAGEISKIIPALAQSAREGRVLLWSAHPEEQELLAPTVLGGELVGSVAAGQDGERRPVVGIFLNDGTAGKMGYYLDRSVTTTVLECLADGSQRLRVDVSLTSTAPVDPGVLPQYVTGVGGIVTPGDVRTNLLVYAPDGGRIEDVTAGGNPVGVQSQLHEELFVAGITTLLSPGASQTFSYTIVTSPSQGGDVILRFTPGPRDTRTQLRGASCATS
ncbi:DUF4012 domain-containing protein [Sanguibacter suaedae]|uniref:DUF4012 domain-containing protein n=1 Tax=Sanguibacter suaedae TaxID=2795737 RepID=A0A934I9F1_9MICO|nr:DUF4012 domain-containing protein [Sanguibacter suaedae]MBI9114620.1 DUF4012 domain-containing protein [Sanguibacter suaedae]